MLKLYICKVQLPFLQILVIIENGTQIVASALTNIFFLAPNDGSIAMGTTVCIHVKYNHCNRGNAISL